MVINQQNTPVITFYVALKVVKCNVSAGNKSNNILLVMTSLKKYTVDTSR